MSDIISFALSIMTDYKRFETLATDIMMHEGFPGIRQLGGTADYGQDALVENIYEGLDQSKMVFQYTVDKKTEGKVLSTIEKLKEKEIEFHTLVYVTSQDVSTSQQTKLKREARKNYRINIDFIDKKSLSARLADSSNGIFIKHFPDIEKQIQHYKCDFGDMNIDDKKVFEKELLKANLAFIFNKDAQRTRDNILDNIILAAVYSNHPEGISLEDISKTTHSELVLETIDKLRIIATLKKLKSENKISETNKLYTINKTYAKQIEIDCKKIQDKTNVLVNDILSLATDAHGFKLTDDQIRRATRNIKNALSLFFNAFGTEIITQYSNETESYPVFKQLTEEIIKTCSHQIGDKLGEHIFDSIGEILAKPNEEQIESLFNWMLAYAGKAIMNIDPDLKAFQHDNFKQKTFALDTDYLINCVVQENNESQIYIQLLKDIISLGAKVVIPDSSIQECITHAMYSYKTINFFGLNLFSIPKSAAKEKIHNAFAYGYYQGKYAGIIPKDVKFKDYILNYYNPEAPIPLMKEVINTYLPKEIEIVDLEYFGEPKIEQATYDTIFSEMYEFTLRSKGGRYRTEEENKGFAERDTLLFIAITYANSESKGKEILGGQYYLLTDSSRYRVLSERLKYHDKVSTRPQSLINIMSIIGISSIDPIDVVKLMENPFIIYSTEKCWDDVTQLLATGIDLSSISIPKLKSDLDKVLRDLLEGAPLPDDNGEDKLKEYTATDKYKQLLEYAESTEGYRLNVTDKFAKSKLDAKESKIKELEYELQKYKKLESELDKFGKRRSKYLKKIIK